jgi:dienelactone hydrolase
VWLNETFNWSTDRREPLSGDTMLANVGLMLGRWPVTQRVQDVLGVLSYLRARPGVDPRRIVLVGWGGGAVVALHAAAIDGTVAGVVAYEGLASYRAVVEAPRHVHSVADFLPGVLLRYDLPDLAAALAPMPVLIAGAEDATGAALPASEAQAAHARARQAAALLGGDVAVYAEPGAAASLDARAQSNGATLRDQIADWIASRWAGGGSAPARNEEQAIAGRSGR